MAACYRKKVTSKPRGPGISSGTSTCATAAPAGGGESVTCTRAVLPQLPQQGQLASGQGRGGHVTCALSRFKACLWPWGSVYFRRSSDLLTCGQVRSVTGHKITCPLMGWGAPLGVTSNLLSISGRTPRSVSCFTLSTNGFQWVYGTIDHDFLFHHRLKKLDKNNLARTVFLIDF